MSHALRSLIFLDYGPNRVKSFKSEYILFKMISPLPLIMHLFPSPSVCHPPLFLSFFLCSFLIFLLSSALMLSSASPTTFPSGHSIPRLFLRLLSSNLFKFLLQSSSPLTTISIILSSILPISYTLVSFYVVFHSPPPSHIFFYRLLPVIPSHVISHSPPHFF
jgi:hypothetical protein